MLRVDGGMVASDWTMQFLADILDAPVERPIVRRRRRWVPPGSPATRPACGPTRQGFGRLWKLERDFKPALAAAERERKYAGWKRSVRAVLATPAAHDAIIPARSLAPAVVAGGPRCAGRL